jgi:hypothetical protein
MMTEEINELNKILERLMAMRSHKNYGHLRKRYNDICNKIDILISKLAEVKSE